MPGNQVGGVLGDQPVQPAGTRRFARLAYLVRSVAAACQHALLDHIGDEAPDQNAFAVLRLDALDRPPLRQTCPHQLLPVDRQQRRQCSGAPLAEQRAEGAIHVQRARLGIQQQRRLRVPAEQRGAARHARGQTQNLHQQLAQPGQPVLVGRLPHLDQQQAGPPGHQLQRQRASLVDGGAAQAACQPAGQPAQRGEVDDRLILQALEQHLVAGGERIALPGRQRHASLLGIGQGARLPAQVPHLAHLRAGQQGAAQRVGTHGQRRRLAHGAQQPLKGKIGRQGG